MMWLTQIFGCVRAKKKVKACFIALIACMCLITQGWGQNTTTTSSANSTPQVPFMGSPTLQIPDGIIGAHPEAGSGSPGIDPPPPQPGTFSDEANSSAGHYGDVNAPTPPNLPLKSDQLKVSNPGDEWNASTNSLATNSASTMGQETDPTTGLPFLHASTGLGRLATPMVQPNLTGLPNASEMEAQVNGGTPVAREAEGRSWRIVPRLNLGTYYDSNIYITHNNPTSSMVSQVGAGFSYELGGFHGRTGNGLIFSYDGTGVFFSSAAAQNAYNQTAQLIGQYHWSRLMAKLASSYYYLSGPNRDTGNFINSTLIRNELELIYSYSTKTDLKLGIGQLGNIFPGQNSSEEYFLKLGADHQVTQKMRLGLEETDGYNTLQNSPNQTYQRHQATLLYNATGKLDLKAEAGVQTTQFGNSGQSPFGTPIWSLGGEYLPFGDKAAKNYTQADFNVYRSIFNSASLTSQDFVATGVALNLLRGIHEWLPSINVGFEDDTYFATSPGTSATRRDNFFFVRPNLGYDFTKYLKGNIFLSYRENLSNINDYGWSGYQAGFNLSVSF
jgi:hypothetical protein